jgi:hypothetical protein
VILVPFLYCLADDEFKVCFKLKTAFGQQELGVRLRGRPGAADKRGYLEQVLQVGSAPTTARAETAENKGHQASPAPEPPIDQSESSECTTDLLCKC